MKFSHTETLVLINLVLAYPLKDARKKLFEELKRIGRSEAEFCASVIEHGSQMPYSANQWYDVFSKVPNKLYEYEPTLMNKLTPAQRKLLGFE